MHANHIEEEVAYGVRLLVPHFLYHRNLLITSPLESIEWFIEDQASSRRMIGLLPHSLPLPVVYARPEAHRKSGKERQLADGIVVEDGGEELNFTAARTPGPQ